MTPATETRPTDVAGTPLYRIPEENLVKLQELRDFLAGARMGEGELNETNTYRH